MQEGWTTVNFAKALQEASTAKSEQGAIDIVMKQEDQLADNEIDISTILAEAKAVFPDLLEKLTVEPFENNRQSLLEEIASIIFIGEPYSSESEEEDEEDEEDEEEEEEDEEDDESESEQITPPLQPRKRREPELAEMTDAMRRGQLEQNVRALKPAYGMVRDSTLRRLLDLETRQEKAQAEEFQPLVHELKKRRVLANLDNPKFANILETLESLLDELQ